VLGSGDYGLRLIAIRDSDDIGPTLTAVDDSGAALESAVRHASLLRSVKDDGNPVTFLKRMHNPSDVDSTALRLRLLEDAPGALPRSVTSTHGTASLSRIRATCRLFLSPSQSERPANRRTALNKPESLG